MSEIKSGNKDELVRFINDAIEKEKSIDKGNDVEEKIGVLRQESKGLQDRKKELLQKMREKHKAGDDISDEEQEFKILIDQINEISGEIIKLSKKKKKGIEV